MSGFRALLIEDSREFIQKITSSMRWVEFDCVSTAEEAARALGFELTYDHEFNIIPVPTKTPATKYSFVLSDCNIDGPISGFELWKALAKPIQEQTAKKAYKLKFSDIPSIIPISNVPDMIRVENIGEYKCPGHVYKHDRANPEWVSDIQKIVAEVFEARSK